MRILHSLVITPRLCGLYESAKEIIKAEEKLGHEVLVREPPGASKGMRDKAPELRVIEKVEKCDVIIDHSGCDLCLLESGIPIVHIRHGRPLSSFLIEHKGGTGVYSHVKRIGADKRYVAIITMWKEHAPYWELLMNRQIEYINPPVDLGHFKPEGPIHLFKKQGATNIVCADMWRDDSCPFEVINKEARENPLARIHIYGMQGKRSSAQQALLDSLGNRLGEVGWATNMAPVYRAADYVITCNDIDTRATREALACGCTIKGKDLGGLTPRQYAQTNYNPILSATQLLDIVENSI